LLSRPLTEKAKNAFGTASEGDILTLYGPWICCLGERLRLKAPCSTESQTMAHNYAINDDVHHQLQGPQGRAGVKQRSVYTVVSCLPIEADGRPRYRIKSKTENVERVVTEEQISRLG
jgi:hypothetical protein